VPDEETPRVNARMGKGGVDVSTPDGRYSMHLWFRAQIRYSDPFDDAPTTPEGFEESSRSIDVRRIRIKLGGNVYEKWLKYYFEYDFISRLLNVELTVARYPWLQFRVGQWKVTYNRERVDSSGKQQFVDRSIVNREFTVDRQPGAMVAGHVFPGRLADSWYFAGLFSGNGPNASNDDGSMMWMGRYQWQFLKRDLRFSQSDVEIHGKPAASLSFAALGNRSPYTRFSTSGAGQLDGFEPGAPGQYDLLQFLEETAFKYKGFSFQQELHWKEIQDNVNLTTTNLRGSYFQAGYLPWGHRPGHRLKPLELAGRYAWVDPDTSIEGDSRTELSFCANWFFDLHENKATIELSRLTLEEPGALELADLRLRLQWDISF
jgi:hypothetical protein